MPDTSLQYAVNSPTPVVRVDPTTYYAVQSGVWFTSATAMGPWAVATTVPPVIYTIPTASPIHYVTYVRVYRYTPTMVYVGYTPGYLGTCYSPWGTVVYGTGFYYQPWIGNYWYGAPWTWGFGAGFYWNSWAGWGWSFGWGGYRPFYNPWWGPYYGYRYRPPVYRPGYGPRPVPYRAGTRPGYNWNNVNVYNRPGAPRPGVRPSVRPVARPAVRPVAPSRPGQPSTRPVQPAPRPGEPSTQPAQPGTRPARPATRPVTRPDNVYAGPDGNVYRPQTGKPGSWETNDRGTWKPVQPSRPETRPAQPARPSQPVAALDAPGAEPPVVRRPGTLNQLSRDQRARSAGDTRMKPPPAPAPKAQPAPRQAPKPPPKKP